MEHKRARQTPRGPNSLKVEKDEYFPRFPPQIKDGSIETGYMGRGQ